MYPERVIAIFDVGKTNKKFFLFDQDYKVVYEHAATFTETVDEDDYPCENLELIRRFLFDSLDCVFAKKEFDIVAINFAAYGASFVYIDENGQPLSPLYNYLKPYPESVKKKFYSAYGGEEKFSSCSASPVLGNLNSGMQLYYIKYEKPALFQKIKYALHLPQYLSYLISGIVNSDITSIGCHTNLWDFDHNHYHEWVAIEGIEKLLPPITTYNTVTEASFSGNQLYAGTGLHDSSAALIPYLINFSEPFLLISSGTWCITLNPFNNTPLTREELEKDCLCYMQYNGNPVKASRLFAGQEHKDGVNRIAAHFNQNKNFYRSVQYDADIVSGLKKRNSPEGQHFTAIDLADFINYKEAYHHLIMAIIKKQVASINLVLKGSDVTRIFVDGGFSSNEIYMRLLASSFENLKIYSSFIPQASALGAALALHSVWCNKPVPGNSIQLQYYNTS